MIGGVALACSTAVLATPPITAPAWRDLTPAQQRSLAPLAQEWQDLPDERKRKYGRKQEKTRQRECVHGYLRKKKSSLPHHMHND